MSIQSSAVAWIGVLPTISRARVTMSALLRRPIAADYLSSSLDIDDAQTARGSERRFHTDQEFIGVGRIPARVGRLDAIDVVHVRQQRGVRVCRGIGCERG